MKFKCTLQSRDSFILFTKFHLDLSSLINMAKFKTRMYISFYCYRHYLLSANSIFPETKSVFLSSFVRSAMHSYSYCI